MNRPQQPIVTLDLPLPPSVNTAFASRGAMSHRTRKTAAYRFWLKEVEEEAGGKVPRLLAGHYGLWIDLPVERDMQGDIDNREKLLSDVLCLSSPKHSRWGLGVVVDDCLMRAKHTERLCGLPSGRCKVAVVSWPQWKEYLLLRIT